MKSERHGTRACYFYRACRCQACRNANAAYQRRRRKPGWARSVPSIKARQHIVELSKSGVGRRSVADAADLSERTIRDIKCGARKIISGSTEQKILSVTSEAVANNSLVDSTRTKMLLSKLLSVGIGFTKTDLAKRLGSNAKVPTLQLVHPKVKARNAMKVEKFFNRIMAE